MAHSKLHIICGNCGQNDQFDYKISTEVDDVTNEKYQTVYIGCKNCNTIHPLDDNAENKNKII
jgi:RNase P subunit RPR2